MADLCLLVAEISDVCDELVADEVDHGDLSLFVLQYYKVKIVPIITPTVNDKSSRE